MRFRYIGSKARVVAPLMAHIGRPSRNSGGARLIDAFCGTGTVAEAASRAGWPVLANDALASAVIATFGRLVSREKVPFAALGNYERAVGLLSKAADHEGTLWLEYSPASMAHVGIERRYFTEHNARRLDGMRLAISTWRANEQITADEERLLIADLMAAANTVANTAGTYGCFLSKWQPAALKPINIEPRSLPLTSPPFETRVNDAAALNAGTSDTLYLDPPYTKRQYASYYHILETIAHGDAPEVQGVAGLRPWQHAASDFCYKRRALEAIVALVAGSQAGRILLSYSDEGHVPLGALVQALERQGATTVIDLDQIGRYRPNKVAVSGRHEVREVLIEVQRPCIIPGSQSRHPEAERQGEIA